MGVDARLDPPFGVSNVNTCPPAAVCILLRNAPTLEFLSVSIHQKSKQREGGSTAGSYFCSSLTLNHGTANTKARDINIQGILSRIHRMMDLSAASLYKKVSSAFGQSLVALCFNLDE